MRILISDLDAENGADVKTTLNVDMQDICEKALRKQSRIFNLPKRAYSVSNSREQKRQ